MIHISDIHIKFDKVIIEDGNLDIYNGQLTGIIGESGCGKTSLLKEIGLLNKKTNMIYKFDDQFINELSSKERTERLRQDISFVMQDIYFFDDLTILEIFQLYGELANKKIDEDNAYDLLHYVNLQLSPQTPVTFLSGGEKQRLSIACGLLKDAKLFIFDEPFAYLDNQNKENVVDIIKKIAYKENKMVIITTHSQDVWNQFDRVYTISNKHLILSKDSEPSSIKSHSLYTPFHFNVLKQYIKLYHKNHKFKNTTLCLCLSIILSLLVVMGKFSENYQKAYGESLLNIMDNELLISSDDGKEITPKQQASLRFLLSDYEVYPEYVYKGSQGISIKGYLDNEAKTFQIYKDLKSDSLFNSQPIKNPIYVSYSLYRKNKQTTHLQFLDLNQNIDNIQYTYVLNPAEESKETILLPYQEYVDFLQQRHINQELVNIGFLKVPINNIQEIGKIKNMLPEGLTVYEQKIIGVSLQTIQFFNQTYIHILSFLGLLIIVLYKIFLFIRSQKDIALWKVLGVSSKNLIKMKGYQEGIDFLCVFIISIVISYILLYIFNILTMTSFINVLIWTLIYEMIIGFTMMLIYSLFILKFSVSQLLR